MIVNGFNRRNKTSIYNDYCPNNANYCYGHLGTCNGTQLLLDQICAIYQIIMPSKITVLIILLNYNVTYQVS